VGNHTYDHDYLALLLGPKALSIEIERGQKALAPLGIRPLAFRPPVGITTPVLGQVLHRMGMYAATFRFRAHDHGNLLLNNLAKATLERVRPDDILVLHDVKPARNQSVQRWLAEVRQLITGLGTKGLRITTLESLIDRPVMRKIK